MRLASLARCTAGGERQMTAMGRAMVAKPSILPAGQNTKVALKYANCGCMQESGFSRMNGPARDMKPHRRRKRWR